MPKEVRKRGKKHKEKTRPSEAPRPAKVLPVSTVEGSPPGTQPQPDAPFGTLDPDLKAYFRTVDAQIQEWSTAERKSEQQDESLSLFFEAALKEMNGKELQLATDPDCAVMLERMLHSMDDFSFRVFLDSLSGSLVRLATHRFSSHICQACFELIPQVVDRECRGQFPSLPEKATQTLRTMTQITLDLTNELLPSLNSLAFDQFGSHVLQSLLHGLHAKLRENPSTNRKHSLRSNKSRNWKAKQVPMVSLFKPSESSTQKAPLLVPPSFSDVTATILHGLKGQLSGAEVRLLAGKPMSSPLLQSLIRIESDLGEANQPNSLLDFTLSGLITTYRSEGTANIPSDFVVTLLRDPGGSHLFETIITYCDTEVFDLIWGTYFKSNLPKLALHPNTNFVLARCVSRLNETHLSNLLEDLRDVWPKVVTAGRTGVLLAAIERSSNLRSSQSEALDALYAAFDINANSPTDLLPTILRQQGGRQSSRQSSQESSIQGSLLLQASLRLAQPYNQPVICSLEAMNTDQLVALAKDAISSRVIDAMLDSDTVPRNAKRKLILSFMTSYHLVAQDRIGSRIAERCWAYADVFLRERIAKALFNHEEALMQSYYGKFFARTVNLPLFRRELHKWKVFQQSN